MEWSVIPSPTIPPTMLTTDASGSWGCGAWHDNQWFQLRQDDQTRPLSIAAKELIPIILAYAAWGEECQVLC
jgi:hypothetical protein